MELVVALAVALLAVPALAQLSAFTPISGVVVDADTRAPIPNATVSAGTARASADAAGRFTLLVEGRRVRLLVEASGYFALTTTLEIPETGLSGAELALARETPFATSVAVTPSAPSAAPATEMVPPVQVLRTPGSHINQARLPVFARADVRVTWRPRGAAGRWELYAESSTCWTARTPVRLTRRLK